MGNSRAYLHALHDAQALGSAQAGHTPAGWDLSRGRNQPQSTIERFNSIASSGRGKAITSRWAQQRRRMKRSDRRPVHCISSVSCWVHINGSLGPGGLCRCALAKISLVQDSLRLLLVRIHHVRDAGHLGSILSQSHQVFSRDRGDSEVPAARHDLLEANLELL